VIDLRPHLHTMPPKTAKKKLPQFYTTGYCAARIGVTPGAIRQWIDAGRVTPDSVLYGVEKDEKGFRPNLNDVAYLWTRATIYRLQRARKAGTL
jgi:hypothetical protein